MKKFGMWVLSPLYSGKMLRSFRIFISTLICMAFCFVLSSILEDPAKLENPMRMFAGLVFSFLFLAPITITTVLILTLIMLFLDKRGHNRIAIYILVWSVPGILLLFTTKLPILATAAAGALYWVLTGRVAGSAEIGINNLKIQSVKK